MYSPLLNDHLKTCCGSRNNVLTSYCFHSVIDLFRFVLSYFACVEIPHLKSSIFNQLCIKQQIHSNVSYPDTLEPGAARISNCLLLYDTPLTYHISWKQTLHTNQLLTEYNNLQQIYASILYVLFPMHWNAKCEIDRI